LGKKTKFRERCQKDLDCILKDCFTNFKKLKPTYKPITMNRKFLYGTSIGTLLVIIGIVLSIGASYGLIRETRVIDADLEVGDWDVGHGYAGYYGPLMLAESELRPGESVTMEFVHCQHEQRDGIVLTLHVEDSTDRTVKSQEFIYYEPFSRDIPPYGWEPDWTNDGAAPASWPLFSVQESGIYSIYASVYLPEDTGSKFELSSRTIITSPPPYAMMLLVGLIILALGIVVVIVGVVLGTRRT